MGVRRKPPCLFCQDRSRAAGTGVLTSNGHREWLLYFCSQRCAVAWAAHEAGLTNEWCEKHRQWHHPDDGCDTCRREE